MIFTINRSFLATKKLSYKAIVILSGFVLSGEPCNPNVPPQFELELLRISFPVNSKDRHIFHLFPQRKRKSLWGKNRFGSRTNSMNSIIYTSLLLPLTGFSTMMACHRLWGVCSVVMFCKVFMALILLLLCSHICTRSFRKKTKHQL